MILKQEIFRKIFHLGLSIIPILYLHLGKITFLTTFIPLTIIIIALDFCRCRYSKFGSLITPIFKFIMRDKELKNHQLSGMSWAFFGASLNFIAFDPVFATTGFFILIFADSMGAIVGKSIISKKFYQKSQAGSLAFFITAIIVIISCGLYFDCSLLFYIFAIIVAMLITYLEAYPSLLSLDDNLLIPLTFGICMSLLDLMWHIL